MKIIEIDGIKYSLTPIEKTQKPQTLYDVVSQWVNDPVCPTVDKLIKDIEQWLPKEVTEPGGDEWYLAWNNGYNSYRKGLLEKLK